MNALTTPPNIHQLANPDLNVLFHQRDQTIMNRMEQIRDKKEKLRIGIYGSSFDPITNVHLWTANTIANRLKLDFIIFLPASDLHISNKEATEEDERKNYNIPRCTHQDRWNMVQMGIFNKTNFLSDDFEMLSRAGIGKYYTYFTMEYFRKKFFKDDVFFIMGADLLVDIADGKWRYDKELIENNRFIVMARDRIDMVSAIGRSALLRNNMYTTDFHSRFELVDKGFPMDISSTYIRQEFFVGGDPEFLLPSSCYEYIKQNHLYGYHESNQEGI